MLVETVLSMLTLVPFEEGDASGLGLFSGAPGVHPTFRTEALILLNFYR
jgi:hypothetical protein